MRAFCFFQSDDYRADEQRESLFQLDMAANCRRLSFTLFLHSLIFVMTILERIKAPTPVFYKKIRNAGLVLVATGSTILGLPVSAPGLVQQLAGYMVVAGTVASSVSQLASGGRRKSQKKGKDGPQRTRPV
jgi:hypothetical protein